MNDVIVIYGPTAVGKSAIAIKLAKLINGEIISADSMQIYKHLNIGSAKVTTQEMQGIKHYLIDIKYPNENYSVSDFCTDATRCIEEILAKDKTPIIVGGTGLYIKSLVNGYDFAIVKKQDDFRNSLVNLSNEEIYKNILSINSSIQIDKNNRHRLVRALEKLKYGNDIAKTNTPKYNFKLFAIVDDRQKIYDRINNRVDKMVNEGLLEEAKYLFSLNLPQDNLAIKAIGYKELFPYLRGECSLEECLITLKQKSRNYAKRQFTFLNQFDNICIITFQGINETAKIIYKIIEDKNE